MKKIKEHNIHLYNEKPQKLPYRCDMNNDRVVIKRNTWNWHTGDKEISFYKHLDRFLQESVGSSYNNVYSKFCNKFPKRVGSVDTRKEFKSRVNTNTQGLSDFTVDKQNRIQWNKNSYKWRRKSRKNRDIEIPIGEPKQMCEVNKEFLLNHPDIIEDLVNIGGREAVIRMLVDELIDMKTYDKLTRNYEYFREKVKEIYKPSYFHKELNKYIWYIDLKSIIFKLVTVNNYTIIKYRSDDYKQYRAEVNDANKKAQRTRNIEREKRLSCILKEIENERKEKERLKDIVDRDRLGFDNQSFKGEFYHGQKRKKVKDDNNRRNEK